MSLSPTRLHQSSPQSRPRRPSRSSLRRRMTPLELASSLVSRDPAEGAGACGSSRAILLARRSNCCARLFRVSAVWRSWPISVTLESCWKCAKHRQRFGRSASRPPRSKIRQAEDITPAFDALKSRVEALYICTDPLVVSNRARIHTLAIGAHLPTIYNSREYVETGGLMSYGPSFLDQWKRAAEIVDKILRGTKPADIPVEQPTKFDLVINLTTAKVLGLEIPATLLSRADEVIE